MISLDNLLPCLHALINSTCNFLFRFQILDKSGLCIYGVQHRFVPRECFIGISLLNRCHIVFLPQYVMLSYKGLVQTRAARFLLQIVHRYSVSTADQEGNGRLFGEVYSPINI